MKTEEEINTLIKSKIGEICRLKMDYYNESRNVNPDFGKVSQLAMKFERQQGFIEALKIVLGKEANHDASINKEEQA